MPVTPLRDMSDWLVDVTVLEFDPSQSGGGGGGSVNSVSAIAPLSSTGGNNPVLSMQVPLPVDFGGTGNTSFVAPGYLRTPGGNGVFFEQAIPIPIADGGTGATVIAGPTAVISNQGGAYTGDPFKFAVTLGAVPNVFINGTLDITADGPAPGVGALTVRANHFLGEGAIFFTDQPNTVLWGSISGTASATKIFAPTGGTIDLNAPGGATKAQVKTAGFSIGTSFLTPSTLLALAAGINPNISLPTPYGRIGAPGAFSVGGFQGPIDGRRLTLYNSSGFTMTVLNNDPATPGPNRIKTLTGADVIFPTNKNSIFDLIYDQQDGFWILQPSGSTFGSGTPTQVAFFTSSSVVSSDPGLYWDNLNKKLGIGTTAPVGVLEVAGPNHPIVSGPATLHVTDSDPLPTTDEGATLAFVALGNEVAVIAAVKEGPSNVDFSSALAFCNAPYPAGPVEHMRITSVGLVGIGTKTPTSPLTVNGTIEIKAGSSGVIKFADGTNQATAAVSGGTLTGTGVATQVAFWSAASNLVSDSSLYWDNVNKRLGIGTNVPTSPLTVNGTIEIKGGSGGVFKFQDGTTQASAAVGGGGITGSGAAGQATFWTGVTAVAGDNGFFWDNTNKRLGIGTTTPGLALHVKTAAVQAGILIEHTGTGEYSHLDFYEGALQQGVVQALGTAFPGARQNTLEIGQLNSGDITLRTSSLERVRIASGGNVGVGTTAPFGKLAVEGSGDLVVGRLASTLARTGIYVSAGAGMAFLGSNLTFSAGNVFNYDKTGNFWTLGDPPGVGKFTIATGTGTAGASAGTDTTANMRFCIDNAGLVGVGTISPSEKLHAFASAGNVYHLIESGSTTGVAVAIAFKTGSRRWEIGQAPGIGDNSLTIYDATAAAVRVKIDTSGNVTFGAVQTVTAAGGFIGPACTVPQNAQAGAYTLVLADRGKHISAGAGVTVPASIFAAGDIVSVYNNTAGNITITQGASVTLILVGTATTGNRTLGQHGLANILCVSANTFVISGGGVS